MIFLELVDLGGFSRFSSGVLADFPVIFEAIQ